MRLELIQYALSPSNAAGVGLAVLVLAALAGWAWATATPRAIRKSAVHGQVFCLMLGMGLADGLALVLLPVLGLSFGRMEFAWVLITLVRHMAFGLVILGMVGVRLLIRLPNPVTTPSRHVFHILLALQLIILACEVQGVYHEPFRLGTSTLAISLPLSVEGRPLRLVQISDLHVERTTPREKAVLAAVARLQPDIIVLTGDYVNLDFRNDPQTWADTRDLLSQLSAPLGIFAVTGTPGVDIPEAIRAIFGGLEHITLVDDDLVRLNLPDGNSLTIVGVANQGRGDQQAFARLAAQIATQENTVLLYHTPDLAPLAAESGKIDLYLAGHTHGGQVRLPFYGAVVTFSAYGLQYQMGRYNLEELTLYVSRGLGMEGFYMPRARFLCPPEIVLVEFKVP